MIDRHVYSDRMFGLQVGLGGLLLVVVGVLGLLLLYTVIRVAVRHGIKDARDDRASNQNQSSS